MAGAEPFDIEVVYALPGKQRVVTLRVEPGTTAAQAVRRCGILSECPEIDLGRAKLGVFGRRIDHDAAVQAGDRIEIYRPLEVDPKTIRRLRAKARPRTQRA
jgi:putative ubiquitin-RnfH superfamily antitoxin RatB of RatAB toxin-antitoxin module